MSTFSGMDVEQHLLGNYWREIDPGRLKLPLTVEARGHFGYALTVARLTFRTAFSLEPVYILAKMLDVSVPTYESYESGRALMGEELLLKLVTTVYTGPIGDGLMEAHRQQKGRFFATDERTLVELFVEACPERVMENLDFLRIEAERHYSHGDLAGAFNWTSVAWKTALQEGKVDVPTSKLALTHARLASNRNEHDLALQVIETAIAFTPWKSQTQIRASLELSLQAIHSRAKRQEGAAAARRYIEVVKSMAATMTPTLAKDPQWRWTWYDALRSAVTCHCDTFTDDDKQQIKRLEQPLQYVVGDEPELGFVYESTRSRIMAVLDEPDGALNQIEELSKRSIMTFADDCYYAKSRILAWFRQGPDGQDRAISESDLYARKCGERLLFHKQETFFLLSQRLRRYVELKQNLS